MGWPQHTRTMKKILLSFAIIAIALAGCQGNGKQADNQINEDSINRILNQKDAEINNLLGTVNDIQDGLRQITEAQGRINTMKGQENPSVDDIRENMAFIQRTMQLNRERIAELQKQLQNSNINAANLKETIETLQQQVNEKQQQIEALTAELAKKDVIIQEQAGQISSLNSEKEALNQDKSNLQEANEAKARTISKQDKDLNRAWYVFGTKKELKEHNILKNGDVLTRAYSKNYLTEVDIRNLKSIPLGSKSAKLLTTHPSGSYTLERDANKLYTLRITDPQTFWSVSKYLVILVK